MDVDLVGEDVTRDFDKSRIGRETVEQFALAMDREDRADSVVTARLSDDGLSLQRRLVGAQAASSSCSAAISSG